MEPITEKEMYSDKNVYRHRGFYFELVSMYNYESTCKYLKEIFEYEAHTYYDGHFYPDNSNPKMWVFPKCKLDYMGRACEGKCSKYRQTFISRLVGRCH